MVENPNLTWWRVGGLAVGFVLFLAAVFPAQLSQVVNLSVNEVQGILVTGFVLLLILGGLGEYQRRKAKSVVKETLRKGSPQQNNGTSEDQDARAEKLGEQVKAIEEELTSPERLREAVLTLMDEGPSEEARLRQEFPQTWLALDKAPKSIQKRGMVKLYIAECRSIRSIESLGRSPLRVLANTQREIQRKKDQMVMDRLIAQILFARFAPKHWWDNL
jgi:hypothetical protein